MYPTDLDSFTTHADNEVIDPAYDNAQQEAISALETKVGIDSSADTTSLDYKVKNASSTDPGHHHTNASIDSLATSKLTGLGTSVATALGVNVGTAGAVVINGGALGTPSSGTMTNVTGLTEAGQTLADNTTNNVSSTKHGYAPKNPNDATKYLDGTGAYSVPTGLAMATGQQADITTIITSTGGTTTNYAQTHNLNRTPKLIRIYGTLTVYGQGNDYIQAGFIDYDSSGTGVGGFTNSGAATKTLGIQLAWGGAGNDAGSGNYDSVSVSVTNITTTQFTIAVTGIYHSGNHTTSTHFNNIYWEAIG